MKDSDELWRIYSKVELQIGALKTYIHIFDNIAYKKYEEYEGQISGLIDTVKLKLEKNLKVFSGLLAGRHSHSSITPERLAELMQDIFDGALAEGKRIREIELKQFRGKHQQPVRTEFMNIEEHVKETGNFKIILEKKDFLKQIVDSFKDEKKIIIKLSYLIYEWANYNSINDNEEEEIKKRRTIEQAIRRCSKKEGYEFLLTPT